MSFRYACAYPRPVANDGSAKLRSAPYFKCWQVIAEPSSHFTPSRSRNSHTVLFSLGRPRSVARSKVSSLAALPGSDLNVVSVRLSKRLTLESSAASMRCGSRCKGSCGTMTCSVPPCLIPGGVSAAELQAATPNKSAATTASDMKREG